RAGGELRNASAGTVGRRRLALRASQMERQNASGAKNATRNEWWARSARAIVRAERDPKFAFCTRGRSSRARSRNFFGVFGGLASLAINSEARSA
ncbi:MAG TPA: hypothetical protein VIV11_30715, partial [Kofleriaceae bacterium]